LPATVRERSSPSGLVATLGHAGARERGQRRRVDEVLGAGRHDGARGPAHRRLSVGQQQRVLIARRLVAKP
jgi:ABC-type molybdenum transport system ATPase subunit/photorepair protein PhrA